MPRPKPPYLHREVSRHGTVRWTVRRNKEPRTYLDEAYGTPEFWRAYRLAVERKPGALTKEEGPGGGTVGWLVASYMRSADWAPGLKPATRAQRSRFLSALVHEAGDIPAQAVTSAHIDEGMADRKDRPHAANNWLKALSGLFRWAANKGHIPADPTSGTKHLSGPNDHIGFHTWTDEEIASFQSRWPLGTRERVAFELLLCTGLRRGDAVLVGRPHVRDGVLRIRTQKTGQVVPIPLLPQLARALEIGPVGELTFIVGADGRPLTKEAFGNWFREACRVAGVPGTAHGLRKAAARRAAEQGASEAELNAWFGWKDGSRESATYVRDASREKLAGRLGLRISFPNPAKKVGVRGRKKQADE